MWVLLFTLVFQQQPLVCCDTYHAGSVPNTFLPRLVGFPLLHFAFFLCLLLSHAYFTAGSWWHFTIFSKQNWGLFAPLALERYEPFGLSILYLVRPDLLVLSPPFLLDSARQPCWTLFCSYAFGPFMAYFTLQEWPFYLWLSPMHCLCPKEGLWAHFGPYSLFSMGTHSFRAITWTTFIWFLTSLGSWIRPNFFFFASSLTFSLGWFWAFPFIGPLGMI